MSCRWNCWVGTQCLSLYQAERYQWTDVLFFVLFFDEDHMIQDTEMSDFKQADPHNQTSAVTLASLLNMPSLL